MLANKLTRLLASPVLKQGRADLVAGQPSRDTARLAVTALAIFLCPVVLGLACIWLSCLLIPTGLVRIMPALWHPELRLAVLAIALTVEVCGKLCLACIWLFGWREKRLLAQWAAAVRHRATLEAHRHARPDEAARPLSSAA
jgi:hypothetical protein